MTPTTTHAFRSFPEVSHSPMVTAVLVFLFWAVAAGLVTAIHATLDPISPVAAVALKIPTIVTAAYLYTRLTARQCTVDHALLVGIAWLLLDIGAEMFTTSHTGRGWFDLIGPPMRPALRDVVLFTWIVAPALFARFPSPSTRERS